MSTHLLIIYSILTVILAGGVGLAGGFVNTRRTILGSLSIVGTILPLWNLGLAFTLITDTFPSELPFGLFLFSVIASMAYGKISEDTIFNSSINEADTESKMWLPKDKEWDRLVELTDGDNDIMHWDAMGAWTEKHLRSRADASEVPPKEITAYRGHLSVMAKYRALRRCRNAHIGFRPAYIQSPYTQLFARAREGESAVIGTLYMGGKPVKVPQNPTWYGDIEDYIPGASLEMRKAMDDPAYQVTGIRVGDVFIADRCFLKNISYEDIENALSRQ